MITSFKWDKADKVSVEDLYRKMIQFFKSENDKKSKEIEIAKEKIENIKKAQ